MKKIVSTLVLLSFLWISNSYAIDLWSLDEIDTTNTNTETSVENTAVNENITLSDMEVIFADSKEIPADGKETTILVKVSDDSWNSLSDTNVELELEITDNDDFSKWSIWEITYDSELEAFNVVYISWNIEGEVFLTLKATIKWNETVSIEQAEDLLLITPKIIEENVDVINNDISLLDETSEEINTLENLESFTLDDISTETESIIDVNSEDTENVEIWANIVSTKVMDENRLKVEFDREIFLPDEPLELVSIKKVSDSSEIKVANITLSSDKKSIIILTTDNIGNEQYHLSISEIIDGETKKKVNVINGELTVTWFTETIIMILSILLFSLFLFIRNKKTI